MILILSLKLSSSSGSSGISGPIFKPFTQFENPFVFAKLTAIFAETTSESPQIKKLDLHPVFPLFIASFFCDC
jgi:hypothetical protein